MTISDKMEKRMNEILVNTQEMLAEIDAELDKMKKEFEEIRKKRAGIENLRRDTLAALGISEQESGKPQASGGQEFDLDSQFDQELDIK